MNIQSAECVGQDVNKRKPQLLLPLSPFSVLFLFPNGFPFCSLLLYAHVYTFRSPTPEKTQYLFKSGLFCLAQCLVLSLFLYGRAAAQHEHATFRSMLLLEPLTAPQFRGCEKCSSGWKPHTLPQVRHQVFCCCFKSLQSLSVATGT